MNIRIKFRSSYLHGKLFFLLNLASPSTITPVVSSCSSCLRKCFMEVSMWDLWGLGLLWVLQGWELRSQQLGSSSSAVVPRRLMCQSCPVAGWVILLMISDLRTLPTGLCWDSAVMLSSEAPLLVLHVKPSALHARICS